MDNISGNFVIKFQCPFAKEKYRDQLANLFLFFLTLINLFFFFYLCCLIRHVLQQKKCIKYVQNRG